MRDISEPNCHNQSFCLNFHAVECLVLSPKLVPPAQLMCASSPLLTTFLSFFSPHAINPQTPPSCRNTLNPLPISSSSPSLLKIDAYLSQYPLRHAIIDGIVLQATTKILTYTASTDRSSNRHLLYLTDLPKHLVHSPVVFAQTYLVLVRFGIGGSKRKQRRGQVPSENGLGMSRELKGEFGA
jgi:hypothetical protein